MNLDGAACHIRFPRYVVTPRGEVVSLVFRRARPLRSITRGKGYRGFTLLDSTGVLRPVYLHVLVAEVFHGAAPAGHEVRHRDGDKTHNAASNLLWGTRSQNMRDKEAHGTATTGEAHPMAKLREQDVKDIRLLDECGMSPAIVRAHYEISRMTHWKIVNRKLWRHVA